MMQTLRNRVGKVRPIFRLNRMADSPSRVIPAYSSKSTQLPPPHMPTGRIFSLSPLSTSLFSSGPSICLQKSRFISKRTKSTAKMSTYVAELPSLTIDHEIPKFFEKFYAVSDNPDSHEEYARSFTDDATFIMGSRSAKGYSEILEIRKGLWSGPVKTRKHSLHKIFPFGDNSNELMLYGNVEYVLKNGKELSVDWAGRALIAKGDPKKLRMAFYQVYLVSQPESLFVFR